MRNKFNPVVAKRYEYTIAMKVHVWMRGCKWRDVELTQFQCAELNLLSGNRPPEGYYCYNIKVKRCGDVIKFRQNTTMDSSVNTRYSWFIDTTTQQKPKPDLGYQAANPTGHFL